MVFNTGETSESLKELYNPEGSDLRQAQLRMLEMLEYFDLTCKQAGVRYRIQAGTVLGAVRHRGFIPWDDDVDVVVPKADYKKLCKYMELHPHPQFVLQSKKNDKYYYNFWNTLRDTHSEYIQDDYSHNAKKYRGLQIDVFCFESGGITILGHIAAYVTWLNQKYFIGRNTFAAELVYCFQKYILHPFFRLLSYMFGNKEMYMHAYGNTSYYLMPASALFPYKPILFEGRLFMGPANPDLFLKQMYGDYMNLPAPSKRNPHRAKWKIW